MTTPAERISRVEGVLEQINERLGNIEAQSLRILEQKADNDRIDRVERVLAQKADKSEVRFLFATTITSLVAIIGLLGAVLARI